MLLALLLTAALAPDTLPTPEVSTARDVSIVVHRQPAVPIVALRVSLLADDPPGYAGAGHKLQHVLLPGLQQRAARVGGRVQVARNSDALVYTLTGPATELPYLAGIIRTALRPRILEATELLQARYDLDEERKAEWEQADAHVRSALRASLFPQDMPAAGTPTSALRLEGGQLLSAWNYMYRPERISVVAIGDVAASDVENAFRDMGPLLGTGVGEVPLDDFAADTAVITPAAVPQATRHWLGLGFSLSNVEPAAVSITARLLQKSIQQNLRTAQVTADHWWTHHGQAIALVMASSTARPASLAAPATAAIERLQDALDDEQIRVVATEIQREMLFASRTPERMAEIVGQFVDRSRDPNAAQQFYTRLARVNEREVRRVLTAMMVSPPQQVEVPAQVLNVRR
jgi:predicted Zn-dependent peptidase